MPFVTIAQMILTFAPEIREVITIIRRKDDSTAMIVALDETAVHFDKNIQDWVTFLKTLPTTPTTPTP